MSAAFLSGVAVLMSLAQNPANEVADNWIHWDAGYVVITKGTIEFPAGKADRLLHLTVRESPDSGVGISPETGQESIKIRPGVMFEQRFGFFWGGMSRPNDPPGKFPRFQLEISGNQSCLVREISASELEIRQGYSVLDLGSINLPEGCF